MPDTPDPESADPEIPLAVDADAVDSAGEATSGEPSAGGPASGEETSGQAASGEPSATSPPAPNRKVFIIFALVFLVLFFAVRWWYFTGQALEQVAVEASVPACTDTTIGDVDVNGESVAAAEVVPGMRCEVIVNIVNEGTKTLVVTKVIAPGLGPDSPLPVRAVEIDGREPGGTGDDAAYEIDEELQGGDFLEVNLAYEYDDSGCLESATYSDARWPTVEVSASNRSRGVDAGRAFALLATDESRC